MLFKILYGDESRISTDVTPYHEGYCYVTTGSNGSGFYVDMNNKRVKLNAKDAETLMGMSFDDIKASIGAISYNAAQSLTAQQLSQAKANLGIYISDTAPVGAPIGSFWIDTSEVSTISAEEVSF